MDENNMGNNNSIENNNDANGFVMVDNPAPQASQEPQEPQTENQNQNQPVQPSPMPSEDNTYRFQNVEAQNVKKKKEKKAKKGMSIPKILVSAVLFGVIAAGCFFGVNKGLSDLFGTKSEIQGVDNSSNNGVALTTVSGSAAPSQRYLFQQPRLPMCPVSWKRLCHRLLRLQRRVPRLLTLDRLILPREQVPDLL
ncbi:unknown [Clostridium sp. CAG:62]|nr:unknown [Clostridium sp. CAG:62]